ncbi:MvdC/MvdD family ATP grasp protein [Aminobacter sp. BE322]|uniref:MvdC/MvdD family ATP grasp protein n=1 Tax=unclassified Aminobacter TaxID=2644704 RepID=UPI003D1E9AB2
MLLVVTNKSDLACDYLILRLKERDIRFVRLNTEDFGRAFQIDISFDGGSKCRLTIKDGQTFSIEEITGVYFRQPRAPNVPDGTADTDRLFVQRELKETLRGLWRLIDTRKWLNHPRDLWLASNKLEQLAVAGRLGFRIPETCVSMSATRVRAFYDEHDGRIICKAVKNGFSHDNDTVTLAMTRRVDRAFIDNFDSYAAVPMIYQREIAKAYDVRVTLIGDRLFPVAIHSQEREDTEVDWRHWDVSAFDLRHEQIELPQDVAAYCRAIAKHFNLGFAAIDLVRGIDGLFYFLEVNPNGQWAWIEQKTGYPIRDAIIDRLTVRSAAYA